MSMIEGAEKVKGKELKKIKFFTSQIKVDFSVGSKEGLEWLRAMSETKNVNIFRGNLRLLITYKNH